MDGRPALALAKERLPAVVSEHTRLAGFRVGTVEPPPMPEGEAPATRGLDPGEIACLLDESGGTGTGYDRLYVDTDADGDLSDEQPVATLGEGEPPLGIIGTSTYYVASCPVEVTVRYPADCDADPKVQQCTFLVAWPRRDPQYVLLQTPPMAGCLNVGGRQVAVGLVDSGADGLFGTGMGVDQLWLDLNGDRRLAKAETFMVGSPICLGVAYLTVKMPADGRWVDIEPTQPRGQVVRLEAAGGAGQALKVSRLTIIDRDYRIVLTAVDPGAEIRLAKPNEVREVQYELAASAPDGRVVSYQFTRRLAEEDQKGLDPALPLQLGGTVKPEMTVTAPDYGGEPYRLVAAQLHTAAGDQLSGMTSGDEAVAPGKLRIIAPDGAVAAEAEIHFG